MVEILSVKENCQTHACSYDQAYCHKEIDLFQALKDKIKNSEGHLIDFSNDLEAQDIINKIHDLNPEFFHLLTFERRVEYIFSKEEGEKLIKACDEILNANIHEEKNRQMNIYAIAAADESKKLANHKAKNGCSINLDTNIALQSIELLTNINSNKDSDIFDLIKKNNDLLNECSLLVNVSALLRDKEAHDKKGLDLREDRQSQELLQNTYDKYPRLFPSMKVDENGKIQNFEFTHAQLEAFKLSCGEQSQILMSKQNVNKGYIENFIQERNLGWEIVNQMNKEHTNSLEKIQRNIQNASR